MYDCNEFTEITSSQKVYQGPCKFMGLLVRVSVAHAQVSVYDGIDPTSGRLAHVFTVPVTDTQNYSLTVPWYFNRGIYVTLDANVTEVTVLWSPILVDPPEMSVKPVGY